MTGIGYVYEVDELKSRVPIEVAAADVGVSFSEDGLAFCPFHEDHNNPNLELMGPGEDGFPWAYCRACGTAVDCIELVRRVEGLQFYEALVRLSRLADELPDDLPTVEPRKRQVLVPDASWYERLSACQARAHEHVGVGLLSYAYGFVEDDTEQPERESWDRHLLSWGWGLDEVANVIIPHYDGAGKLVAIKVKYRDGSWKTFGGLKHLYGGWRRREEASSALLCEGESDCVWADRWGFGWLDVLSLPSGAGGAQEDWISLLCEYELVYLGMDEDAAGREAVKKWVDALECEPVSTRRLVLPDGHDLRSSDLDLPTMLRDAKETE